MVTLLMNFGKFSRNIRKGFNFDIIFKLKFSTWLNKLYLGFFDGILKFLEQLISEHLQTDDAAVEGRTQQQGLIYGNFRLLNGCFQVHSQYT